MKNPRFSLTDWILLRNKYHTPDDGSWKYTGEPVDFSKVMLTPEEARIYLIENFKNIGLQSFDKSKSPAQLYGRKHITCYFILFNASRNVATIPSFIDFMVVV